MRVRNTLATTPPQWGQVVASRGDSCNDPVRQAQGSLAKVHKTCLETWLGNQAIDQCEICKYQYMTARRPKGFHEWLMNSSTREDKQNLVGDMVALLLLTPLVVFSLWLCTEGAIQFSHEGFPTWESAGLVFITIVLFVVFCVWVTLLYSAVVVEELPELDTTEQAVPVMAESPCTPSKESPPKSTSSTLIIYTPAV
ncbi:hypothetical protein HPB51_007802 [Rhipicephalus microplus]|uniref:RING-CH-type domain-containing protein n=1 Tax=Rhipicephalus microplus TaxID=6941 RepID=A0A9J6EYT5_RHIMP|nr:hypothetical protein HPB51_007802 [Rhipicephalus microplus]